MAEISLQEFNNLSNQERLNLLRQVPAREKEMLLVEAADGARLLAQLPIQDVYLTVKELGPDHLPELLSLTTPDQWTAFYDFDCWQGDQFDAARGRQWLVILLAAEEQHLVDVLQQMNFELLTLMLRKEVQVVAGPEDIEDEDAREEAIKRDGGYELDYHDEDGAKLYGQLLETLFKHKPDFYRYLVEAVRAETESMIEESVYQQRRTRLLDLGMSDPFEAQSVYAWLDPDSYVFGREKKLELGSGEHRLAPGFALTLAQPGGLLGEALAAGLSEGTAWELACVVNKAAMADGVELGDVEQLKATAVRVHGLLNLAMESLADAEEAIGLLDKVYVEELCRLGFSQTLKLQQRAKTILGSAIAPYLDLASKALLQGLVQRRPRLYNGVDRPEEGGYRDFCRLREVHDVEDCLALLELQQQLFDGRLGFDLPDPAALDLTGCEPDSLEDLTLEDLFLTALANRLLGRAFLPLPLAADELVDLHHMVCCGGEVEPRLCEETAAWLDGLVESGGAYADLCLGLWEQEFCSIDAEALDPRFVGGLIVRI